MKLDTTRLTTTVLMVTLEITPAMFGLKTAMTVALTTVKNDDDVDYCLAVEE